jgi:hypothetical protein
MAKLFGCFWLASLTITALLAIPIVLVLGISAAQPPQATLVVFGFMLGVRCGANPESMSIYEIDIETGTACLFHTFGSFPAWPVAWSPDYSHLAVETTGDIYVIGEDGDVQLIEDARSPSWSPGQELIFEAWSAGEIRALNGDIIISENVTGAPRDPAWSPDGTQIAYVCGYTLCVADVATQQFRQITTHDQSTFSTYYDLAWSLDGSSLIMRYGGGAGADTSLVIDATTGETLRSTIGAAAFSPDMRYFAYFTGDYQGFRLVIERDGIIERETPNEIVPLAWSPDSRYLAYSIPVTGIALLDLQTGNERLICQNCFLPSWRN